MRIQLRPAGLLTLLAMCAAPISCSLLLDAEPKQCRTNDDCKRFDPNAACVANLCELHAPVEDGGGDAGDAGPPDSGPPLGPPGCFAGTPSNDFEFYNACTRAAFLTFDNCARAGLCPDAGGDAGAEPALVKPDAGSTTPTTPVDGGPGVSCYDAVDRPNVIFMNGSTNFTPFIRAMAPIVAQSGYVIVWQPTSSCGGADTVFNVDPTRRVMRNPVNSGQTVASFYTATNLPNGTPCMLGGSPNSPGPNQELTDIGQSDIFATSCPVTNAGVSPFNTYEPGQGNFMAVRHYTGPVQSMVFVVPASSSQRAISAEAARIVFGVGPANRTVAPWVSAQHLWVRSATTGTAGIISRGIGIPATDFWGVDQRTAPNMVTQIKSVSTADSERTMGLLSIDFADKERDNLHILYFQPRGAIAGFLPDATRFSRDKENVRNGHYPLWGPIHLYARETAGGNLSQAATAFITQFAVPRPDTTLLDATIDTGNVPTCAMRVGRESEMGPLRPFEAPFQCHCYYERKVNGATSCKACGGPADCPSDRPACNLGFCEKQ